tara:strand:+ start:83 stop:1015 length:933 start_codon:yes stop_codon:yes gene_type:complete
MTTTFPGVNSVDTRSIRVGFIGAGRTANALATALHASGYHVTSVSSRTPASAGTLADRIPGCLPFKTAQKVVDICNLVFITTPDDAIRTVVSEINWHPEMGVVHCSGAEPSSILNPAGQQGAMIGSFHPMQTFPKSNKSEISLLGITFAIDGSLPLLSTLTEMASELGGQSIVIEPHHRTLYHLSGFLACGAVTALINQAVGLWAIMGYTKDQGLEVLLPILKSTVNGLETQGLLGAMTGPISRGDIGTVQKHLNALEDQSPELISLYCNLALTAIKMTNTNEGIYQTNAQDITRLLEEQITKASTPIVS